MQSALPKFWGDLRTPAASAMPTGSQWGSGQESLGASTAILQFQALDVHNVPRTPAAALI
jgi:hypothetical protein